MKEYKHYSFDLWLTLIRSNKKFKEMRNSLFCSFYNPGGYSLQYVTSIIHEIDEMSTKYSEMTGEHVQSTHMIFQILSRLGNKIILLTEINSIDKAIQDFFITFPPVLYDNSTLDVLNSLSSNGKILNILSNTGFIHGSTIKKVLPLIGIDYTVFNYQLYSDELNMAKPNPNFFNAMRTFQGSRAEDILHVGDNPIADGGSEAAGIKFFQINSNYKRIIDIL